MKNIYVLSTDKPSRLFIDIDNNKLTITNNPIGGEHFMNQNIYITSDDKFVRDEYVTDGIEVIKASPKLVDAQSLIGRRDWKKIILTTDQDLIKNGVQAIDDEFLEWFVKNPSCEYIKTEKWLDDEGGVFYSRIIPKEEPKPIHQQIIDAVGGEDKFKEISNIKPKQELERGITITHLEKQEKLHNLIKERLNRKEEQFKHEVKSIPKEEILANRSNAYEFIDFDKKETEELNPYIEPFLLKNGFEKFKYENNIYTNPKCTINVLEGCYEILFENEYGEVSTYTDSWSIPHLVGTLTWNDLIDKNYNK